MTIHNDLSCDLDFFWDYTLTGPCGDIVPADDKSGGPNNNLVPSNPLGNHTKVLFAYELKWPTCSENPNNCACPTHFKFRIGNPSIGQYDPLVAEPWPSFATFPTWTTITYYTQLQCSSCLSGYQNIAIHVTRTGPKSATFRFFCY
jgi:hypothetical protein